MAKKYNTHPILQKIKTLARELQSNAKQSGSNLIYGHALDQASAQYGYKDWNTACGMSKSDPSLILTPQWDEIEFDSIMQKVEKAYREMRGRGSTLTGTQSLAERLFYREETYMGANFMPEPTAHFIGRAGQLVPFDFSTNHTDTTTIGSPGVGASFYIKDLIRQAQEENPSFSEEEATEFVYDKYKIQTVLDSGESMDRMIENAYMKIRKYSSPLSLKSKYFVRSINDKHAKVKFSARSR